MTNADQAKRQALDKIDSEIRSLEDNLAAAEDKLHDDLTVDDQIELAENTAAYLEALEFALRKKADLL